MQSRNKIVYSCIITTCALIDFCTIFSIFSPLRSSVYEEEFIKKILTPIQEITPLPIQTVTSNDYVEGFVLNIFLNVKRKKKDRLNYQKSYPFVISVGENRDIRSWCELFSNFWDDFVVLDPQAFVDNYHDLSNTCNIIIL